MSYAKSIRKFRKARSLSQSKLAELMEVEQPTIQRWESGKRQPSAEKIVELARVLGVKASELFSEGEPAALGPSIFLKGEVSAGRWVETYELPEDGWKAFTGRPDITANMEYRFGLRVVGDVASEIYPSGTILECISTETSIKISNGKRVIVVRTRNDGRCETTVKEYFVDEGGTTWLLSKSSNPALHSNIRMDKGDPSCSDIRIAAMVTCAHIPE